MENSGTNAVLRAAKDEIKCPICRKIYNEPKTLACLHSFCRNCIAHHVEESNTDRSDLSSFHCPVCNVETAAPPSGSKSPSAWADNLPTNAAIMNILKAFDSSELPQTCSYHPHKELEFVCEEHGVLICSLCATTSHKKCEHVVPIEEADKQRRTASSKLINSINEQISTIEKILVNRESQLANLDKAEKSIKEQLSQLRKRVTDVFDNLEVRIIHDLTVKKGKEESNLNHEIKICQNILEDARGALDHFQESLANDSPVDFLQVYAQHNVLNPERQSNLLSLTQSMRNIRITFTQNKTFEQILMQSKNLGNLSFEKTPFRMSLHYSKSLTDSRAVSSLQTPREFAMGSRQPASLTYRAGSSASSRLSSRHIVSTNTARSSRTDSNRTSWSLAHASGVVKLDKIPKQAVPAYEKLAPDTKSEKGEDSLPEYAQDQSNKSRLKSNNKNEALIEIQYICDFDASVPNQHECSIEGAAVLKSGHVVLSDSYHSSLKLFDKNFVYLGCVKFATAPGDVTAIADDEVIVCLPDLMQLKHEKIQQNKIIHGDILAVGDKCTSVSFSNGILATSSGGSIKVYTRNKHRWIRDMTQKVDVDNLMYIALNHDAERIVVTKNGYPTRSVICLNRNGQTLWSFKHDSLRLPRGVTFLGDQILVASWDQHKVLQLNRDGQFMGVVMEKDIQWPWKLCFDADTMRVFVTQCYYRLPLKDKNSVKVFTVRE